MSLHSDRRYLAFDYGEKRIGVACGNAISNTAASLAVVSNQSGTPDWQKIDELVETWQPVGLVVGDPISRDGAVVEITRQARGFGKRLKKRYSIEVHLIDERHSSMEASELIRKQRQQGTRGRSSKGDLDRVAAAILMERWFAQMMESHGND